ncbi:MAG: hypothetical protein WC299_11160 [Kiritimatiellia bacterium]
MMKKWIKLNGVVERGHGVAAGFIPDNRYPHGTLALQIPIFKARGLDLGEYHRGTLNISLKPFVFEMINPQYTFRKVAWTDHHPPEDFSFSRCALVFSGKRYDAWVYYPHPETKKDHFQDPAMVEVITKHITGIEYGRAVELLLNPDEVNVKRPAE